MSGRSHRKSRVHASTAKSDINVTPLIDIVLVLLIVVIVKGFRLEQTKEARRRVDRSAH